jgi:hypothetical protein
MRARVDVRVDVRDWAVRYPAWIVTGPKPQPRITPPWLRPVDADAKGGGRAD